MELADIGRVYHYLLKYRQIESRPSQRRQRPGESELAYMLRSASPDDMQDFNEFVSTQGLKLTVYDDTMSGVSSGSFAWLLVRDGEIPASSYLSTERVHDVMNLRGGDSKEVTSTWFLHIWLITLSILYTRAGRSVSEVSGYVSATFSKEVLVEAVEEHLTRLRSVSTDDRGTTRVVETLDAEKGKDVERRISQFLRLMVLSHLVSEVSDNEYQQTLLGAHEIAELYSQSLQVPVADVLGSLTNMMTGREHDSEEAQWD